MKKSFAAIQSFHTVPFARDTKNHFGYKALIIHGESSARADISAWLLPYGKENNNLNKKHEVCIKICSTRVRFSRRMEFY